MNKAEKQRRRAIVRGLRDKEHAEAEARMPISKPVLKELFRFLDRTIYERRGDKIWCSCDHTLRRTRDFLRSHWLDEDAIAKWLGEYGGFCDCEVAMNVSNYWNPYIGY